MEETVGPAPLGMSFTLATIIPGARKRVELEGARISFPDERAPEFNQLVRALAGYRILKPAGSNRRKSPWT